MCVGKLCVSKLCVDKLCVDKLCVVAAGAGRTRAGRGQDAGRTWAGRGQAEETRTPHKDVGNQTLNTEETR